MHGQGGATYVQLFAPLVAVALILLLRGRHVGRSRQLKVERLWIIPTLYSIVVAGLLWHAPPHGSQWLWGAIALLIGGAMGWWRGRSIAIQVDPETHAINHMTSWATIGLILILFAVRYVSRLETASAGLDPNLVVNLLALSALGILSMARLEMFLRARRLLVEARAA